MESKTQEMDVMGYVVALSSKNHEKKHKNSVKISVRLEEELAVFVVSQLPEAKYNQAIDAHKQGILLRIKGKVKKEKKQYRFVEIENFTLNSK